MYPSLKTICTLTVVGDVFACARESAAFSKLIRVARGGAMDRSAGCWCRCCGSGSDGGRAALGAAARATAGLVIGLVLGALVGAVVGAVDAAAAGSAIGSVVGASVGVVVEAATDAAAGAVIGRRVGAAAGRAAGAPCWSERLCGRRQGVVVVADAVAGGVVAVLGVVLALHLDRAAVKAAHRAEVLGADRA